MFDGGIRNGMTAIGYLAIDPNDNDKILFKEARTAGLGTSNEAEYRALIGGLEACIKYGLKRIHIIGDSQLIIQQVLGGFKVNKLELKQCLNKVRELLAQLDEYSIRWIPRSQNKMADKLVNSIFKKRHNQKWKDKQLRKKRRKQLRQSS